MTTVASPTRPGASAARGDEPSAPSVVVLGTGSAGMKHLESIARIGAARALAVPVRQVRRTQLEDAGIATAATLEQAVQMGAGLCVIATDTGRHVQDAMAAMDRGLDVLVEKPLASTAAEARRAVEHARSAQRKIFAGCVLRFADSLNTFRTTLPQIGAIHSVRIECQSYLPAWRPGRLYHESYSARADEGGVLRDVIHEIDYAGWLFGWPKAVAARLRNLGRLGIEAEESAELMWETAQRCAVSITLDYLSQPPRRQMRAYGDAGTLEWDALERTVTLLQPGGSAQTAQGRAADDEMFAEQMRAFIATRSGQQDPRLAGGEEGWHALAVCDAARIASSSRRETAVEF